MPPISYARHQFPPVLIPHAVWLYLRFTLSDRDGEDLLAERRRRGLLRDGAAVGPKVRARVRRRLRHSHPRPSRHRHLDEMVMRIAGESVDLRRTVDHEGEVLDILVQRRQGRAAALKLMRTRLTKQGFAPAVVVTDRLRSDEAALEEIGLSARHKQGRRQDNRAENLRQLAR